MIDFNFEQPDTRWGWCPTCGMKADIWNETRRHWECTYCNWSGRTTLQEDPRLKYQPSHFKEVWE